MTDRLQSRPQDFEHLILVKIELFTETVEVAEGMVVDDADESK